MYTVCTFEEWRSEYFDLDYCRYEYGEFDTYQEARRRADAMNGIVISLMED